VNGKDLTGGLEMMERILAGRYRLLKTIGGRGDLFRATDESLCRQVVVQRLPVKLTEANRRFMEGEIARAASLQSPHLLSIFDVVVHADDLYVITEDWEGETLSRWIQKHAPLTVEAALEVLNQLAGAVHEAHRHGVEEVCIDPNTVWVTREGFVKVHQYGPLLLGQGEDRAPTSPQKLIRTLVLLLCEMLTGEQGWERLQPVQLKDRLSAHLEKRECPKWVPTRLTHIVLRGLRVTEEDLYSSMQEFYKEIKIVLHALKQTQPLQEEEPRPAVQQRQVELVQRLATRTKRTDGRKRLPLTVLWACLVVLLVGGGMWWTLGDEESMATNAIQAGKEIRMPSLLNKTEEQAFQLLKESGFPEERIQVVYRPTEEAKTKGLVYRQSTQPDEQVLTSELIVLTVNGTEGERSQAEKTGGKERQTTAAMGEVPSLIGLPLAEAEQTLLQLGYRYGYVIEPGNTPAGTVFQQSPLPGTKAEKGSRVTFQVSR
jgi:hypothetical protein